MNAYTAGFRSAKYHSPIDELRKDWQFLPPYNKSAIQDTYHRKGMIDGRRALGRPSPGQEMLLEQMRRIPMDRALQAAVEEGVLRSRDADAREDAFRLQRMFTHIRGSLKRIREIRAQEKIQESLSGIPEFDSCWEYLRTPSKPI